MTLLLIGPEERAKAAELVARAEANPIPLDFIKRMSDGFDPDRADTRKVEALGLTRDLSMDFPGGVRASFTIDEQPDGPCRHLSVGCNRPEMVVRPEVLDEIMELFGFRGRTADRETVVYTETYRTGPEGSWRAVNVMEQV